MVCVAQPPSAVSSDARSARQHSRGRLCHTDFALLKCYKERNAAPRPGNPTRPTGPTGPTPRGRSGHAPWAIMNRPFGTCRRQKAEGGRRNSEPETRNLNPPASSVCIRVRGSFGRQVCCSSFFPFLLSRPFASFAVMFFLYLRSSAFICGSILRSVCSSVFSVSPWWAS